jgi:hypothetical protein
MEPVLAHIIAVIVCAEPSIMDHPQLHNHDKVLLETLASSKELNINQ